MKLLQDYTGQELEALTGDELQRLIDIECANRGVPLIGPPPEEPQIAVPEPDLTYYVIAGTQLAFRTREKADNALELLAMGGGCTLDADYSHGYRAVFERLEPITATTDVETKRTYSPEAAAAAAHSRTRADELKVAYRQQKEEWSKANDRVMAVANDVREVVEAAWSHASEREYKLRAYYRYVEIADGNRAVALKFMRQADYGFDHYFHYDEATDTLAPIHFRNPVPVLVSDAP